MQTLQELPKACVILGAGASTDVHNGSAPILHEGAYKPPLASDLFAVGEYPQYFQLLRHYSGAQALASILSPMSGQTGFALENELRSLSEH